MARLIYSAIASLDGYVADESGNFDWAAPDEEVHRFVNELERSVGTHLLGRRMYETMAVWESLDAFPDPSPVVREFAAIWQEADKIVYSSTLEAPATSRTRVERDFAPEVVRALKKEDDRDISVGGPTLAAQAIRAGLVDEYQLFLAPTVVGAGNPALPNDVRVSLRLLDQRSFAGGMVYLRYASDDSA
jgi:dihydrofolate reductase